MKITSLANITEQPVSHNREIKKKVMIAYGELPNLTNFSQAKFAPGQVARAHTHYDMVEIFFVEAGNGLIKINGKDYPLEVGTCVVAEAGEEHEVSNTGEVDLILTYFGLRV